MLCSDPRDGEAHEKWFFLSLFQDNLTAELGECFPLLSALFLCWVFRGKKCLFPPHKHTQM